MNSRFYRILNAIAPFFGLVFVVVLFAAGIDGKKAFDFSSPEGPTFLGASNLKLVATQTVIVGIGALGMTMIIISAGIDLSVGSVVALTSVLGAVVLKHNLPPALAIAACVLAGALIGLINGSFISA